MEVWQEWQFGPGMTLVSVGQGVAAGADNLVQGLGLSPIERDFATCARTRSGNTESPIPTASSYAPLRIQLDAATTVSLLRAKGAITQLAIVMARAKGGR